jgi:hypothetical protein
MDSGISDFVYVPFENFMFLGPDPLVESNNNLLNLLKLAITTLDSSNPTQLPPNNNSSIADSGWTGFYFGPNAPVSNYDAKASAHN